LPFPTGVGCPIPPPRRATVKRRLSTLPCIPKLERQVRRASEWYPLCFTRVTFSFHSKGTKNDTVPSFFLRGSGSLQLSLNKRSYCSVMGFWIFSMAFPLFLLDFLLHLRLRLIVFVFINSVQMIFINSV
jgi:hypothetical protein